MSTEEKIREIEQKVEARRRDAAREEARRDAAKAELKKLLKRASDEFGATSINDLGKKVETLQAEADAKMAELREKTDGL